jgi:hypothetical protein
VAQLGLVVALRVTAEVLSAWLLRNVAGLWWQQRQQRGADSSGLSLGPGM